MAYNKPAAQRRAEREGVRAGMRELVGALDWVYLKTPALADKLGLTHKTVSTHVGKMVARGDPEFWFDEWGTSVPKTYRVGLKIQRAANTAAASSPV